MGLLDRILKRKPEMAKLAVEISYDSAHEAEGQAQIDLLKKEVERLGGTIELEKIVGECEKCKYEQEYKSASEIPSHCPKCGDAW